MRCECKNCGHKMVIPAYNLTSDIEGMTGDYCSKLCIELRREKLRNEQ